MSKSSKQALYLSMKEKTWSVLFVIRNCFEINASIL